MRLLVPALALLVVACATAPPRPSDPAIDAVADRATGPLLWEVTGPGGSSHLYGTVHVAGHEAVPEVAKQRLVAARTVVVEMDTKNVNPLALVARGMLPADQSLERLVGPALWSRLVEELRGSAPELALRRFKPWLAATLLIARIAPAPAQPMDQWFQVQAVTASKPVVFLETMDQQLAALERFLDVKALADTLEELPRWKATAPRMIASFLEGDVAAIEGLTTMSAGVSKEQSKAMFEDRNRRWLPTIARLTDGGGAFVAVGAGHLLGDGGLVALLRARGATVRRVQR